MDHLTKEQRHKNMAANKSKGTKLELLFGKLLWNAGIKYHKNDESVIGKPDFTIRNLKIAIFCDGEFWHGKDWEIHKNDHKSNCNFWHTKIEQNIKRDIEVNEKLKNQGWKVFRFWETEILKEPDKCLNKILNYMNNSKASESKISITQICNGNKISLQIYGSHSLNNDGTIIPFEEQMAIVSHYLHNQGTKFAQTYQIKALGLIEDIYNIYTNHNADGYIADPAIQYSLFADLFSVPFLPIKKPKFTFIDLFAGIGGFRMAMQNLGGKCVFSSEWDKQAQKTYLLNYGEVPFGDITKESIKSLIPDNFDILCAGFPCQAFSLAGKKLGFDDIRGTLFYEFARCIKEVQPLMFMGENVRGLKSHDKGKTLKTILEVLDSLGYDLQYKILNASEYGVAQKRERIVIIGTRKGLGIKFEYPKPYNKVTVLRDALKDCPKSEGQKYSEKKKKILDLIPPGGCWIDLPEELQKEYLGKSYYSGGGKRGMARRISWDEPCLTLTCSPSQKQTERCHPDETRPFTVREYARIQSFPDDWEFSGGMGEKYKQIGNAVPVELARNIGIKIVEAIEEYKERGD